MPARGRAHSRFRLAALGALVACAGARGALEPAARPEPELTAFEVPGRGGLALPVPPGWMAEAGEGEPPAPMTIRLRRPGGSFLGLVTPFWNPGEPEDELVRADTAQVFAEIARRKALAGSVEREIPLEELVGEEVHGFWFAATDRELEGKETGPDEWRHLLQGAAAVGPLLVAFTLLDDGPGPQRDDFLEMIRGARHLPEADVASEEVGMELDPGVRTVPLRVAPSGRRWAVLVDLPDFRMFKPHRERETTIVLGQDPKTLIVASVILRRAGAAGDAVSCRQADLARIRAGVAGLGEIRLTTSQAAALATYRVDEEGQEHAHANAWLFRDGVCANVHLSKVEPEPGDEDRMERILASVRFGEDL